MTTFRKFATFTIITSLLIAFLSTGRAEEPKKEEQQYPATIAEKDVVKYLQDISVTIRSSDGEGSGIIKVTKDGQIWVWTAGHVIDGLRIVRESADKKPIVEFNDAQVVKTLVEDGRKVGEITLDAEVIRYSDAEVGDDLALLRLRAKGKFKPIASAVFYLDKEIPAIGTDLYHCGSLLGTLGSNSLTTGIMSQHGRLLFKNVVFDQTTCTAFPGSSGGIVCLKKDGRYVGMLVRGAGEGFNLIVPVRRIHAWAKKTGVDFAMDESVPVPTEEELKKRPIDDAVTYQATKEKKTSSTTKIFPFYFRFFKN